MSSFRSSQSLVVLLICFAKTKGIVAQKNSPRPFLE
jgi:hypothetical protein